MPLVRSCLLVLSALWLVGCGNQWNDPYPQGEAAGNVLYSSFDERPKHLDPARSYSANEAEILTQIVEPPLQYHYLKRPYTMEPLAAAHMPRVTYLDVTGRELPADAPAGQIALSRIDIDIKPGMRYAPHPAFARDARGQPVYLIRDEADLDGIETLADFTRTGSREVRAEDFVYQIKRLADPRLSSPIFGLMGSYIVGLKALGAQLESDLKAGKMIDLRRYALAGAEALGPYHYRITIQGKYPQFLYWLAMPFFAPTPWEAEHFYAQPGMDARNLVMDWQPVGAGAYWLAENNPNRRMVLQKNPYYHGEAYPREGEAGDAAAGLLKDAGKPLPFIDRMEFILERESIPYWNKFLQGYYDSSGISSDNFDQVVQIGTDGDARLSPELADKGMQLTTAAAPSIWYLGFNMLDAQVGGFSERHRKLRQALSIALDYEEFISIFLNGRGEPAQGPIPPGIPGYVSGPAGINPYVYKLRDGKAVRRPLSDARKLLAEAGYPNGRDRITGKPLVLYFDTMATGPDAKARLDWLQKQFARLGVQLVVRGTDYNRFQDKIRKGNAQIFEWGWNADYPDPENFLFLLYGPNKKVDGEGGENASNYDSPAFNRLYGRMKYMDDGPARDVLVGLLVDIVRYDAPWVFAFYPKAFGLRHGWMSNSKPNLMARNTLKYKRLDPALRERYQAAENQPVRWPFALLAAGLVVLITPAWWSWRRRERGTA
jgi:ABC-type transport system substrate-binding protein